MSLTVVKFSPARRCSLQLRKGLIAALLIFAFGAAAFVSAQAPAPAPEQTPAAPAGAAPAARGGRAGRGAPAYPVRPPADPAAVARGKQIFSVNCSFCHGSDARGGEGGPNLIRSELVMGDKDGEIIATVVQNGRLIKACRSSTSRWQTFQISPHLYTASQSVVAPQS